MQHRNNDRIKNLLKPQANIIRWIWDWMKLLQAELRNVITGGSKSRSAFYEVYYKACLHIMGQKGKKDHEEFCTWKELVAGITAVDASDDSEKETDNDNKQKSDEGKKSPEALALLLVRECKRADILLKPHHVEELYAMKPLEFRREMIHLKVRATSFWRMSMDYDYTEKEDSRDDTVQNDRKFIALRELSENLRRIFVRQSVMTKSIQSVLRDTCQVQVDCKEHLKCIETKMEKVDNQNELANAFGGSI